jgi:D-alanine-D-alanine ligase-like ATP-grasp enzyme
MDTFSKKSMVDDKDFGSRMVRELGFAAPRHVNYSLQAIDPAVEFLRKSGGPCVVKPAGESGGRGITTRITSQKRLIQASLAASGSFFLPRLMLEEEQPGDCYRLLFLNGRLLHAVKRAKPTVVGDGVSDIRELVRKENARRQDDLVPQSLSELTLDLDLEYTLADQGLSLRSVPAAGKRLEVKNVSNQNSRGDQSAVTDAVNPAYREFGAKLFERLGAHLVGIDVMSVDIAAPPADTGSAVLEINIPAGLHYHELVAGETRFSPVGSEILDYLLAENEGNAACRPAAASVWPAQAQPAEQRRQRIANDASGSLSTKSI